MAAAVLQGMYYVSRGERDRGKVSDISLLFLSHAFSSLFPLYSVCTYMSSQHCSIPFPCTVILIKRRE